MLRPQVVNTAGAASRLANFYSKICLSGRRDEALEASPENGLLKAFSTQDSFNVHLLTPSA
jgi:hypothetical protein